MSAFTLLGVLVALSLIGFVLGRARAVALHNAGEKLHSRAGYHGGLVSIATFLPAFVVMSVALIAQPEIEYNVASANFPAEVLEDPIRTDLEVSATRNVAEGLELVDEATRSRLQFGLIEVRSALGEVGVALPANVTNYMIIGARDVLDFRDTAKPIVFGVCVAIALLALLLTWRSIGSRLRARNMVENVVRTGLLLASGIAILTTLGIVLSMLWESIRFFEMVPPQHFFFGTTWNPGFVNVGETELAGSGGRGSFGLLPLLWGTAYISLIALLIAVPIGLLSAVYMSEFAGPRTRAYAKPLIEVLAGVPTIVYGFFALVTVGPFIRDMINTIPGMSVGASSVATAGVVMGIMIIPFVSSLSDDIINAVPQSLRDGAYGLGATKAETVRQVILPAALPGIVGAVLLAASRAIGETMIVVLAAGATAKIDINPFEAMTTVTVKIVSQLTGDVEFTSPQALVAFALGLTLFVVTLVMNIVALRIVRKYREQYE
ncbi:MAG: phosphate ABC transporter permease subunit PstC [Pseudomonadota bacterium]